MSLINEFRSCWLIATFGCILFIAGSTILFWNEGRAVNSILSLEEALDDAVTLNSDEDIENNLYDGRIVHISGPLTIAEPLTESDYNIQILSVKLKRRVQMYQWVEETVENNFGESTQYHSDDRTYYYIMDWRDKIIDSRRFYMYATHQNPTKFPIESQTQIAETVNIGKFELGTELKNKFNKFNELTSDSRPDDPAIKLHLGLYYHSNDIFDPEIGDLRILFSFAGLEGDSYTIVGKLEKGKIVPYVTSRNQKILILQPGELRLEEVFKNEQHTERMTTWGFRFSGWVLIYFGATCTATILHYIFSRIYFLSSLAPDPTAPVGSNLILSLSFTLIITALAWVFHRPWIGAGLILAAFSPLFYCTRGVVQYQRVN